MLIALFDIMRTNKDLHLYKHVNVAWLWYKWGYVSQGGENKNVCMCV